MSKTTKATYTNCSCTTAQASTSPLCQVLLLHLKALNNSCCFKDFCALPVDAKMDKIFVGPIKDCPNPIFASSINLNDVMDLPMHCTLSKTSLEEVQKTLAKSLLPMLMQTQPCQTAASPEEATRNGLQTNMQLLRYQYLFCKLVLQEVWERILLRLQGRSGKAKQGGIC